MGITPAQSELNAALRPILGHIQNVFLIHHDLVVATKTTIEHKHTLSKVMEAVSTAILRSTQKNVILANQKSNLGHVIYI